MDGPTDQQTDRQQHSNMPSLSRLEGGGAEKLPGKADGKQLSIKTAYLHNIGIET